MEKQPAWDKYISFLTAYDNVLTKVKYVSLVWW